MKKKQVIILAVLLAGGIWFLKWRVNSQACGTKVERISDIAPYYEGLLVDTHVHMPVGNPIVKNVAAVAGFPKMPVMGMEVSKGQINCFLENEGIEKIFGFYLMPKYSPVQIAEIEKVAPFFMPPPVKPLNFDITKTRKIISANLEHFVGIGELAVYQESWDMFPTDPYLKELYQIASENNLIVMIHVSSKQQKAAEEIVNEYPNITFLFHGEDYVEWVMYMMKNYENFYYSLDANIASLYGFDENIEEQDTTKEEYLGFLESNFDENLEWALDLWQEAIETYPDRFMWGTDRWYKWTYDPVVGAALVEFGRAFIGRLEPTVQEKFAYQNAEKLLQLH